MNSNNEAEWDLESIKRYEQLLMFEAEYPVKQMELLGSESWLCCLCDKTTRGAQSSVLTVYMLPPRLRLADNKAPLSPNFDLKITAGAFTNKSISQIACLRTRDCLFASEEDVDEIIMYHLNTNDSDRLVMSGVLNCNGVTNPNLSAGCDMVVASATSHRKISLFDIRSKLEVGQRKWHLNVGSCVRLKSQLLSPQLILVYEVDGGQSLLFDTRLQEPAAALQDVGEISKWTCGCDFEEGTNIGCSDIGFVSTSGHVKFYDLKRLDSPYSKISLGSRLHRSLDSKSSTNGLINEKVLPTIKLSPLVRNCAAISGLDSRLYVINTRPNCTVTFTHDGHEHTESCLGSDTLTTSHVFFTPGGEKSLISSSDNSSINCWSYNAT